MSLPDLYERYVVIPLISLFFFNLIFKNLFDKIN